MARLGFLHSLGLDLRALRWGGSIWLTEWISRSPIPPRRVWPGTSVDDLGYGQDLSWPQPSDSPNHSPANWEPCRTDPSLRNLASPLRAGKVHLTNPSGMPLIPLRQLGNSRSRMAFDGQLSGSQILRPWTRSALKIEDWVPGLDSGHC